jgi:hypothetical protein
MYRSLLALAGILFFFYSCQKEYSNEAVPPSRGSLQNDLGECLPKLVNGGYVVDQAFTDSNYIDVSLDIVQTGSFTIYTDTVNGYSFKAQGTFNNAGTNTVRLQGTGKPQVAGDDVFTVFFDSSFCTVQITVLAGGTSGGTAAYTLEGAGASCSNFVVAGTYTQGTALTSANTVSVPVNVTTPGTWSIASTSITGFSFSGSGTFSSAGVQNILLTGSGTPTVAGTQTFMVNAGGGSCSFTVPVTGGTTPPPSGDHFILTDNSWWSYSTPAGVGDTLKRSIAGSVSASGVSYKILKEKNVTGVIDDSLYVRKSGNNYYEINYVDYYTSFYFDNPPVDSLLFLKEGLATGETWSSKEYSDAVNGTPTKVKYVYTCTNANATISLNGKTYTNVYQVTLKVQVSENGGPYTDDVTWTNYYAQGIGWIYQKYDDGTSTFDLPIRFYQVF